MRSPGLFVYEGHEWEPRKTKLSVYEADQVAADQIAMGVAGSTSRSSART